MLFSTRTVQNVLNNANRVETRVISMSEWCFRKKLKQEYFVWQKNYLWLSGTSDVQYCPIRSSQNSFLLKSHSHCCVRKQKRLSSFVPLSINRIVICIVMFPKILNYHLQILKRLYKLGFKFKLKLYGCWEKEKL